MLSLTSGVGGIGVDGGVCGGVGGGGGCGGVVCPTVKLILSR